MATIEKRSTPDGNTAYRVKVRLRGHPQATATFARLTDAKRWAAQTETAIRERRHFKNSEAQKHTVADLIDRYVREVLPQKGPGGRDQERQLAWWRKELGAYTLADMTPARLGEARDKLRTEPLPPRRKPGARRGRPATETEPVRHRSPATVNRYLAVLSHGFTVAAREWEWTEDNPLRKVRRPSEPRGRVRFLSDDERARLLEACKAEGDPLYTVVVLLLSTGARKREITTLEWPQVDLARGVIRLEHTKNKDRRALPLTGQALELMRERAKVRRIDTTLVFPSAATPKPGERRRAVTIDSAFRRAVKAAQIENFRVHDLRHSAASYLAMSGATLPEIAAVLGHRTLAMVQRYSHLSADHVVGVVERMNRKVFGDG